jgi:hypothetical protein
MSATINCEGARAGVEVLACISQSTDYLIGWFLIITVFLILYTRLVNSPNNERLASSLFGTLVVVLLGSVGGMFFPSNYVTYIVIAVIATSAILVYRNG